MPRSLSLAVAQSRTLNSTAETLNALELTTKRAASANVDLILFPEAYLGGYPRTCNFGASVGAREPEGREQFLAYFHEAVDLGDTPRGAGDEWVDRKLPVARGETYRGDGTREELERIARHTGVFLVTGLVERAGGSLYCSVVYVCPREGCIGKRRKVMPTGSERLIWAQGSPSSLRAVTTRIKGVKLILAAAICWENYMPMLRQSLYSQNVNLYLAPTADARATWAPLMQTVGAEGRCFVLSANQCQRQSQLPNWITGRRDDNHGLRDRSRSRDRRKRRSSTITKTAEGHELCLPVADKDKEMPEDEPVHANGVPGTVSMAPSTTAPAATGDDEESGDPYSDPYISRGGSCIVSPFGEILAGPIWETKSGTLLTFEADFEDCERGRLDLDVAGSYSRGDAFKLTVEGLDLNPPP